MLRWKITRPTNATFLIAGGVTRGGTHMSVILQATKALVITFVAYVHDLVKSKLSSEETI